jgi:hypothetical protein
LRIESGIIVDLLRLGGSIFGAVAGCDFAGYDTWRG